MPMMSLVNNTFIYDRENHQVILTGLWKGSYEVDETEGIGYDVYLEFPAPTPEVKWNKEDMFEVGWLGGEWILKFCHRRWPREWSYTFNVAGEYLNVYKDNKCIGTTFVPNTHRIEEEF